jgi:CheY-like chemotaxis protein
MQKIVFVVDDNDANLAVTASALEANYRVLTVPSVQSMFSLMDKTKPDLIMLDIEMPETGRNDVITRLKETPKWKKIPIILRADNAVDMVGTSAAKSGAADIIGKDVPFTVLRNAVRKQISPDSMPSILVVDDQEPSITELMMILTPEYTVYEAESGLIAIKEAEKYTPDIILLDILMPEMDGFDVIEELKASEKTKDIPVIFITALKESSDEEKGLLFGAADYIGKPYYPETVKLRVLNQLRIINHSRSYDERLAQQALLTKISHSFLSDDRADTLYSETLRMVGEFMDISKVLLYSAKDKGTLVCRNEWLNPEMSIKTHIGRELILKEDILTSMSELMTNDLFCINSNISEHKERMHENRDITEDFITTPIYIKGELCALLDFTREANGRIWSESELGLAVLFSDILAGVFKRDAIEYDLNIVLKLKEELIAAKDLAERSNHAKSEFLSRMSHEMLTPMNAILGMMQIAKITDSIDGIKNCIDEIEDASHHMVRMVKNVLDVSGGGSTITFVRKEFKFKAMLDYVLSRVNPLVEKKNQAFTMDISSAISDTLFGDEKRIAQVMVHLLTNASKFTPIHGKIHLEAHKQPAGSEAITLQFSVTDNGIGISKDKQRTLFDIFEQIDGGITRKQSGIGVGLALSKLIVEMMNGKIWIESEEGKGTRATFTCKVHKGSGEEIGKVPAGSADYASRYNAAKTAPSKQPVEADSINRVLEGKRILIVDDVATNRKVVGVLLRQKGAALVEAKNGKEAVEIFTAESNGIDLILMDIAMPEMDGYEATRQIRASGLPNADRIPIIALSANTKESIAREVRDSGMNSYLEKPVEPHILYSTIIEHLG